MFYFLLSFEVFFSRVYKFWGQHVSLIQRQEVSFGQKLYGKAIIACPYSILSQTSCSLIKEVMARVKQTANVDAWARVGVIMHGHE